MTLTLFATLPFIMDADESVDINTPLDFMLAEMIMDHREKDGLP